MARGKRDKPSWVRFSGIGIEFAGAVAGFAIVGYYVDKHYDSKPWGVLIGAILGLIGGMYNLVRVSLTAVQETKRVPSGDLKSESPPVADHGDDDTGTSQE